MAFQIITDLAVLDELWRAGILYVSCSPPGEAHVWNIDTEKEVPVSIHVTGAILLRSGRWRRKTGTGRGGYYFLYNTWAVQVEN